MLRVDEISHADAIRGTRRDTAVRFHAAARVCACGAVAALIAASLFVMSASAQAPTPTGPSTRTQPAVTVAPAPSSKIAQPAKKPFVSPYARAAAQRERAGQPPAGHAPTMVQGMGRAHKPHAAAPPK